LLKTIIYNHLEYQICGEFNGYSIPILVAENNYLQFFTRFVVFIRYSIPILEYNYLQSNVKISIYQFAGGNNALKAFQRTTLSSIKCVTILHRAMQTMSKRVIGFPWFPPSYKITCLAPGLLFWWTKPY